MADLQNRRFPNPPPDEPEESWDGENDWDDGFDELTEAPYDEAYDEEEPLTEEERRERSRGRARLAFGAGNLVAVIGGTVVILLMLTLLFNMIHFVVNDFHRNFSLFQTGL